MLVERLDRPLPIQAALQLHLRKLAFHQRARIDNVDRFVPLAKILREAARVRVTVHVKYDSVLLAIQQLGQLLRATVDDFLLRDIGPLRCARSVRALMCHHYELRIRASDNCLLPQRRQVVTEAIWCVSSIGIG